MSMKSIRPKSPVGKGVVLGIVASIVTSLLLWFVILIVGRIVQSGSGPNEQSDRYVVIPLLTVATMVVSLLPGVLGGAANACVLYRLFIRGKLTRTRSVATGVPIAFLLGFLTILGMRPIVGNGTYGYPDAAQLGLLVAGVAAPVGAWHGWRLGKWLLRVE